MSIYCEEHGMTDCVFCALAAAQERLSQVEGRLAGCVEALRGADKTLDALGIRRTVLYDTLRKILKAALAAQEGAHQETSGEEARR